MLLQLLYHPLNGFYMLFAFVFDIDKNIIKIYYYKHVKLLCQDLINVTLECGHCIDQSKTHHLVLEILKATLEGRLLFIAFPDPHLMINIGQIELGETSSSP